MLGLEYHFANFWNDRLDRNVKMTALTKYVHPYLIIEVGEMVLIG